MTDSGSLVTSLSLSVGDSTSGAYTFSNPTSGISYCVAVTNTIV